MIRAIKKLLLIATGALTNSTTVQQGETIPGIAHAVSIEIRAIKQTFIYL